LEDVSYIQIKHDGHPFLCEAFSVTVGTCFRVVEVVVGSDLVRLRLHLPGATRLADRFGRLLEAFFIIVTFRAVWFSGIDDANGFTPLGEGYQD